VAAKWDVLPSPGQVTVQNIFVASTPMIADTTRNTAKSTLAILAEPSAIQLKPNSAAIPASTKSYDAHLSNAISSLPFDRKTDGLSVDDPVPRSADEPRASPEPAFWRASV
jgi:hypothetical protein